MGSGLVENRRFLRPVRTGAGRVASEKREPLGFLDFAGAPNYATSGESPNIEVFYEKVLVSDGL